MSGGNSGVRRRQRKPDKVRQAPWKLAASDRIRPPRNGPPSYRCQRHGQKAPSARCSPTTSVLVGATDNPTTPGAIWNDLVKYKYEGRLFPVNAKREKLGHAPVERILPAFPRKAQRPRAGAGAARFAAAGDPATPRLPHASRHHRHLRLGDLQDEESQRLAAELKRR